MRSHAFYSSFLFIIPLVYSVCTTRVLGDVSIATCLCLITSALNHYHRGDVREFQCLDRCVVRAISCVYVLHAVVSIGLTSDTAILYTIAGITLVTYIIINSNDQTGMYDSYHAWVHLFAVTGICMYIDVRTKYLQY